MNLRTSLALLLVLVSCAGAQIITLPPGPYSPGQSIQVTLFNNLTFNIGYPCGSPFYLMHDDGNVIVDPWSSDCAFSFPQGTTFTGVFTIPADGPGSAGSFVFGSHYSVVRMDVGAPSASFSQIHGALAWNPNLSPSAYSAGWTASNTGLTAHTFGSGDQIRIFTPGGTVPVVATSINGLTVPAQFTLSAPLPLSGLAPGPYTAEMMWLDPATNLVTTTRHGFQLGGNDMELRLRGGHVIPSGGAIRVELAMAGVPWNSSVNYAFCIGLLPGSTPLPSGKLFPLVADPLVMASFADGVGGLLIGNVGTMPPWGVPFSYAIVSGIGVTHPGAPFSGIVVRAAAVSYDPATSVWRASQGEDLVIQ